jgi:hypothetical protein
MLSRSTVDVFATLNCCDPEFELLIEKSALIFGSERGGGCVTVVGSYWR